MLITNINRTQAFLFHLAISLVIFLVILYFIVFHWYPWPFFAGDGGWQGIRIVALVDIILGPLLTLIVFRPGKPSLKFDLSVIALIQITALVLGVSFVHQERPVATIWAKDRFHTVPMGIWEGAGMQAADLKKYGDKLPVNIYMDLPDGMREMGEVFRKSISLKKNLYQLSEYYRPFDEAARIKLQRRSIDMETYLKDRPADMAKFQAFEQSVPAERHLSYLSLHLRFDYQVAVVDAATMEYVEALDIVPPSYSAQVHGPLN